MRIPNIAHVLISAVCAGKLPEQPVPQFPSLFLRRSNDVRHDPPVRAQHDDDERGPGRAHHRRHLPRSRPPRLQQHVRQSDVIAVPNYQLMVTAPIDVYYSVDLHYCGYALGDNNFLCLFIVLFKIRVIPIYLDCDSRQHFSICGAGAPIGSL